MDHRQYACTGILTRVLIACCLLMMTSCKTIHPKAPLGGTQSLQMVDESIKIDKEREQRSVHPGNNIPYSVNNALLPSISSYVKPAQQARQRFDVTASNIPAKEFFMGLVSGTNYNMLISPKISGTISIDLKNVTITQTLEAIKDMYGYDYRRTSYGFEIFQPQIATKIFHINYLDVTRTGHSYTQLTTGQISNKVGSSTVGGGSNTFIGLGTPGGTTPPGSSGAPEGLGTISSIETKSEMKFWKDIEKAITSMVTKDAEHNVTVNAQTGIISVRAYPSELKNIDRFINNLQSSLNRQVILEAKILEVQLDDQYQAGIDWSVLSNPALIDPKTGTLSTNAGMGQAGNNGFADTELKPFIDGIFAIKINGNFKTLITLLQEQGNVQILSSPHISTVNNQKAVIKVGQDEFFVTGVSTTNSVVGTTTLPSQDVTLTPFFSGITLDVTPEISSDNTVILHIHPSVSKVTEQEKKIGLGVGSTGAPNNLTLPLAKSTIRESDNIVRAKNGQVVVIGGLMTNTSTEQIIETPGVGMIPYVGALFRRTKQVSTKSELVILLRPVVASNKNYIKNLENQRRELKILKRPFHFGGLPHIFGNEAEREVD